MRGSTLVNRSRTVVRYTALALALSFVHCDGGSSAGSRPGGGSCVPPSGACSKDFDCCSLLCQVTGEATRACRCSPELWPCTADAVCCAGTLCRNGVCVKGCLKDGQACAADGSCCSGGCEQGVCGPQRCNQAGESCR